MPEDPNAILRGLGLTQAHVAALAAEALLRRNPHDLTARAGLAEALMRLGRTEEAVPHWRTVAAGDPSHRAAHFSIAAWTAATEGDEAGRAVMAGYLSRHPVWTDLRKGVDPAAPALLKVRGLDRTRIILFNSESRGVHPRYRGGHFTTEFLLTGIDFPVHTLTIAGENIMAPGAVPPHAVILNTIAEPDVEARSLATFARWLEANPGTRVLNRPDRVLLTTRDANWRRLRGFRGVRFPRTARMTLTGEPPEAVAALLAGHGFQPPLIMREVGTQTGRTTVLIRDRAELLAHSGAGLTGTFYAIEYVPIFWRAGIFRKLRLFHIDGAWWPVVCHLDGVWNVHGGNRRTMMLTNEAFKAEEMRFLADFRSYVGARAADALDRLAEIVGLDFFGLDFTVDGNGDVFVYELNAAMRHSFDHARLFPYKLPHDLATTAAFTQMIRARLAPLAPHAPQA